MSTVRTSLDHKRIRRLIWLVLTVFVLLGYSLQSVAGSLYYSILMQAYGTVSSPPVILQNGTAGTSTIYTNNTSAKVSVQAPTAWLNGWDERVKITINSTDIDEGLTDFPVLVYLSSSSGENNDNVTSVFDEVGSDYNATAYTTSDGTTRLYFEVEYWNATSEKAWIWVKVPSISNTTNTDIYMYYDSTKDGSAYNSPTYVWDSSFKMVQHLKDKTTSTVEDSTSNDNDGTKKGTNEPVETEGEIGKAQNFDGLNDNVTFVDDPSLHIADYITCEAWVNCEDTTQWRTIMSKFPQGTQQKDLYWFFYQGKTGCALHPVQSSDWSPDVPVETGSWVYLVLTYNGSSIKLYKNGSLAATQPDLSGQLALKDNTYYFYLGCNIAWGEYHQGKMDEVRISNISRSAAWIKASYESERDDLLDFGSEEIWNWWNTTYDYRKRITIANNIPSTLGSGYSVLSTMDTASLVSSGKMLSNGNDMRIVYWNGSSWIEIDRDIIDMNTSSTQVWFKTQGNITASGGDSNYYVYYSNPDAGSPPAYWSDSMGNDTASKVYLAADDFQEHNDGDSPDGWDPVDGYFKVGSSGSSRFMNSTANGKYVFAGNSSWTDYVVKLKMQDAGNASVYYPGIAVRVTNVSNLVYFGWRNTTCLSLWKVIGGSYTLLGDWAIPDVGSAWHTHEIRVKGQNLHVYHDGTYYGTASLNAGELTSGKVGIFSSYGTHGHWDDYVVREYVSPEPTSTSNGEERINYDYVLRINNTVTDPWQIRLKEYSDSNINRLENCTIYFHNSTHGTSSQIIIENGSYTNQTGPWYDLDNSETIYIAMTVQANSTGTSYVHAYLEILIPDTSTYAQHIITFEIT